MRYDESWVPPWRSLEQARCVGELCGHQLVVASTLDAEGLCALCSDGPAKVEERELRFEL